MGYSHGWRFVSRSQSRRTDSVRCGYYGSSWPSTSWDRSRTDGPGSLPGGGGTTLANGRSEPLAGLWQMLHDNEHRAIYRHDSEWDAFRSCAEHPHQRRMVTDKTDLWLSAT